MIVKGHLCYQALQKLSGDSPHEKGRRKLTPVDVFHVIKPNLEDSKKELIVKGVYGLKRIRRVSRIDCRLFVAVVQP
jgi:hypothetical protein